MAVLGGGGSSTKAKANNNKNKKSKKLKGSGGVVNGPKNENDKKKKKKKNPTFGEFGPYQGVNMNQVNRLVKQQLQKEIKGLKADRRSVKRDARDDLNAAKTFLNRGQGDLSYVYGEVADHVGALNSRTQQGYEEAKAQRQAANEALQAQINSDFMGGLGASNNEAARLGLQGSVDEGAHASAQSHANLVNQLSQQSTMGTLDKMQANAGNLGNMLAGMVEGSRMSQYGILQNNFNDEASAIRQHKRDSLDEINRAIQDIKGSRDDVALQWALQLQNTGWNQFMDLKNYQLQKQALKQDQKQKNQAKKTTTKKKSKAKKKYTNNKFAGSSSGYANPDLKGALMGNNLGL